MTMVFVKQSLALPWSAKERTYFCSIRANREQKRSPTCKKIVNKTCIQDTKNLLTDADRRTDTILGRLRDLSL